MSALSAYAIEQEGDPEQYEALGLVTTNAVTLLVEASSLGTTVPHVGDTLAWAGDTFTLRSVDRLAPDGTPILYTLVGSR